MPSTSRYFFVLLLLACVFSSVLYVTYVSPAAIVMRPASIAPCNSSASIRSDTWLDEYRISPIPRNLSLELMDDMSALGKYNWSMYSKSELQQWDREATEIMQKYNTQCQNQTHGTAASDVQPPDPKLPICPCVPPDLQGAMEGNFSVPTWAEVDAALPLAMKGGTYGPEKCRARQKVAVIIPYREREAALKVLLRHLHLLLRRQQAHYVIYIVEQLPGTLFNRALLMNVGFVEARRTFGADCYIFHDVDLISMDDRLLYRCDPQRSTHLPEWIDKHQNKKVYDAISGGALAIPRALFEKINGYSNLFYGWGGEDDEIYWRLRSVNVSNIKPPKSIARYHAVKHPREKGNSRNIFNVKVLRQTESDIKGNKKRRFMSDGLSSLNYTVVATVARKSFMHVYIQPVSALSEYRLQPDTTTSCAKVYSQLSASLPECARLCSSEHACAGFLYHVSSKTAQCHRLSSLCLVTHSKQQATLLYIRNTQYVPMANITDKKG